MVNSIRPNYVNPLKMMKSTGQVERLNPGMQKTPEKQRKTLETKKQSIQNALLLMKGTSGDSGASEEHVEMLVKKLEEITNEIRTNKRETGAAAAADPIRSSEAEEPLEERKRLEETRMDRLELHSDRTVAGRNLYETFWKEE